MSIPKRHHTLPRFYLAGFAREGLLWLFDRQESEYRRQSVINTAVEKKFYTRVYNEEQEHADVEALLAKVEGHSKPILESLAQGDEITADERETFAFFVALLYLRTPGFRGKHNAFAEATLKRVSKIELATAEQAATWMERAKAQDIEFPANVTPESVSEFFTRGEYSFELSRNESIMSMLMLAFPFFQTFRALEWRILHAPARKAFITSDEPIALIPSKNHQTIGLGSVGLLTPGVVKVVPLQSEACLLMGDPGKRLFHGEATREQVRELNLTTAVQSRRFAMGRDRALIHSLVQQAGLRGRPPDDGFEFS